MLSQDVTKHSDDDILCACRLCRSNKGDVVKVPIPTDTRPLVLPKGRCYAARSIGVLMREYRLTRWQHDERRHYFTYEVV
jgi:hypothetical protein